MSLDDNLITAVRTARHYNLSYFADALKRHRKHESFRVRDWAHTLELGFTCECSGEVREWRIDIRTLKEMVPEARESFMRFCRHMRGKGNKARKQRLSRAEHKAKALLHRFLTREQRWTVRGGGFFLVNGKNGYTYEVSKGGTKVLIDGVLRYHLCVVPKKTALPTYDTMLAHKVLLECDPDIFLQMAHVWDFKTKQNFVSGDFLVKGAEPPPVNEVCEDALYLLPLPNEVLDNPRPWMEEQFRNE